MDAIPTLPTFRFDKTEERGEEQLINFLLIRLVYEFEILSFIWVLEYKRRLSVALCITSPAADKVNRDTQIFSTLELDTGTMADTHKMENTSTMDDSNDSNSSISVGESYNEIFATKDTRIDRIKIIQFCLSIAKNPERLVSQNFSYCQ